MRVRRKKVEAVAEAFDAVTEFLASSPTRDRVPGARRAKSLSDLSLAILDAESRTKSGEWGDADARVMIGFYAWAHRATYGVEPVELQSPGEFKVAVRAALRVLRDHFDMDGSRMALFVKWSWKREGERAKWAQDKKVDRNRMGWRLQFSDRQITDFRIALSQRRA